jgi:D-lactate dehydrogenase
VVFVGERLRLVFYELEDWEKEYYSERFGADSVFVDHALSVDNADAEAEGVVVFIYSEVTSEVLDRMPKLRLIATQSTGFDHIDLGACRERGVAVVTVPSYGEATVAEHTFALLLAISRQVIPSVARVRAGSFDAEGLRGFDLAAKTFGVVGTGSIGRHAIQIARGFGMHVLAYDPFPNFEAADHLGFAYVGLDELLSQSDVISLHCPYNEHTHHIINSDNLSLVKPSAVLLNTARGKLVDSEALFLALREGRLLAAGLDVLEEEANIKEERQILSREFRRTADLHRMLLEHMLIHLPNVIVTPHNAFNSQEALERILDTTASNIDAFCAGEQRNRVV